MSYLGGRKNQLDDIRKSSRRHRLEQQRLNQQDEIINVDDNEEDNQQPIQEVIEEVNQQPEQEEDLPPLPEDPSNCLDINGNTIYKEVPLNFIKLDDIENNMERISINDLYIYQSINMHIGDRFISKNDIFCDEYILLLDDNTNLNKIIYDEIMSTKTNTGPDVTELLELIRERESEFPHSKIDDILENITNKIVLISQIRQILLIVDNNTNNLSKLVIKKKIYDLVKEYDQVKEEIKNLQYKISNKKDDKKPRLKDDDSTTKSLERRIKNAREKNKSKQLIDELEDMLKNKKQRRTRRETQIQNEINQLNEQYDTSYDRHKKIKEMINENIKKLAIIDCLKQVIKNVIYVLDNRIEQEDMFVRHYMSYFYLFISMLNIVKEDPNSNNYKVLDLENINDRNNLFRLVDRINATFETIISNLIVKTYKQNLTMERDDQLIEFIRDYIYNLIIINILDENRRMNFITDPSIMFEIVNYKGRRDNIYSIYIDLRNIKINENEKLFTDNEYSKYIRDFFFKFIDFINRFGNRDVNKFIYKVIYIENDIENAKLYTLSQILLSVDKIVDLSEEEEEDRDFFYDERIVLPYLKSIIGLEIISTNEIFLSFNERQNQRIVGEEVKRRYQNRDGNFFDQLLRDEYDYLQPYLEMFQIYTKDNLKIEDNCFINCLKQSKLYSKELINAITFYICDDSVKFKTLKDISNKFHINIIITYYENDKYEKTDLKKFIYDKNDEKILELYMYRGSILNHYMLNCLTPFTAYFIKHSKELKEKFDYLEIKDLIRIKSVKKDKIKFAKTDRDYINTNYLIKLMILNDYFKPLNINDLTKTLYAQVKTEIDLPYQIGDQSRELKYEKKECKGKKRIFFADCETFTNESKHKAFCISFTEYSSDKMYTFTGEYCLVRFIDTLFSFDEKVIVYFHNLSYDGRLFYDFSISHMVLKQSKIYSMSFIRTKYNSKPKFIKFKDSLALIPIAINKFKGYFRLKDDYEKEVFPYNYYKQDTINNAVIEDCWKDEVPQWDLSKIKTFKDNLQRLGLIYPDGIHFNALGYAQYYCERDVKILKQGFIKQRETIFKEFNLDICESLTVPALAYKYFCITAFNNQNIHEYSLNLRDWIRQAVVGGRCMSNSNKNYIINEDILDYDACSLYPSAIHRLFLPTGPPKIIEFDQLNWDYLNSHIMKEEQIEPTKQRFISNYVVEIEITNIKKDRQFPLVMIKNKEGNKYVNECCNMIVDNIYLEDLIKYQEIEFKIIKGIYWTGKKSTKFSEQIEYLYGIRAERKRQKDQSQEAYKLMMNSTYGKTIQKPILDELHFFQNFDDFYTYWIKNNYKIKSGLELNPNCYMVKQKCAVDDNYIPCIIGVLILSMSKRIMNEVICTGEDAGCRIYYQDTDSIHIVKEDLPKLEAKFKELYGRDIRGSDMGQFHSDFRELDKDMLTWSKKCIIVGKKMYLDILTNEKGSLDYHIRLKGIPEDVIKYTAIEKHGNLNGEEIVKLYEDLYKGKEIEFDLMKTRPRFKMSPDLYVVNLKEFKRKVKSTQLIN